MISDISYILNQHHGKPILLLHHDIDVSVGKAIWRWQFEKKNYKNS